MSGVWMVFFLIVALVGAFIASLTGDVAGTIFNCTMVGFFLWLLDRDERAS